MPLPIIGGVIAGLSATTLYRTAIAWFIANIACKLIFRTMFSIGIGYVAYKGADIVLEPVSAQLQTYLSALPIDVAGLLEELNVHEGIGIMFSAATYAAVYRFSSQTLAATGRSSKVPLANVWK